MSVEVALSLPLLLLLLLPISSISYVHNNFAAIAEVGYSGTRNNTNQDMGIAKVAAYPTIDVAKLTPKDWYSGSQTVIHPGASEIWLNNDTESHIVTPVVGSSIESLLDNKLGTPNGILNSGLFKAIKSLSYKFDMPTAYTYVALVQQHQVNVPKYPVDAQGKQITNLPVYTYTNDGKLEVGLSWDPQVIVTGKDISFFVSFFDLANNRPHLLPYNFIMVQNGRQLENIPSLTQLGINIFHFAFANPGRLFIEIENVGGTKAYAEFNTTVYNNSNLSSAAVSKAAAPYLSPNSNPFTINPVYVAYGIIFAISTACATVIILYKKGVLH